MAYPRGQSPARELVDIQAGARRLGCSVKTLRRRIATGELPAFRLKNSTLLRIEVADLDNLLEPVTPTGKLLGSAPRKHAPAPVNRESVAS